MVAGLAEVTVYTEHMPPRFEGGRARLPVHVSETTYGMMTARKRTLPCSTRSYALLISASE
jgi:hypothetical protein